MAKYTYEELYTITCWDDIKNDLLDALIQHGTDVDMEDEIEDILDEKDLNGLFDMVWNGDNK
jgi:hypothetical protein